MVALFRLDLLEKESGGGKGNGSRRAEYCTQCQKETKRGFEGKKKQGDHRRKCGLTNRP